MPPSTRKLHRRIFQRCRRRAYRYDPFGRIISKTHTQGGTTSTTYFVYNETGLMAELNDQGQMTKAYGFNPQAAQAGLWSTDPLWQAEVSNNNDQLTGVAPTDCATDWGRN